MNQSQHRLFASPPAMPRRAQLGIARVRAITLDLNGRVVADHLQLHAAMSRGMFHVIAHYPPSEVVTNKARYDQSHRPL